jgi:uncharacterized protein YxjI
MDLDRHASLLVVQRRELAELIGFETRNQYELRDPAGNVIGYAIEQGKGLLGALFRMFLGHFRRFDIDILDAERRLLFRAHHPFRWFFQRLELSDASGAPLGALQQRFALLGKRFDLLDARDRVALEMRSGLFRIWTFPLFRDGAEVARIEKKWGGVLREAFTDADTFLTTFTPAVRSTERVLILAAAIFVDLQYFEKKAD